MSDQATEAIELPRSGDAAFASLMDVLAPEEKSSTPGATGASGEPAPPGAGPAAGAAADPAAGAGAAAVPPVPGGDAAGSGVAGGAAAPAAAGAAADSGTAGATAGAGADGADGATGAGAIPAAWTADAATYAPKLAELSTGFETLTKQAFETTALQEVQVEHKQYFDVLQQHPRLLVGTQVPAIGKEGMETLRDAQDAKDWQDAVKSLLVDEVRDRASKAMDEQADFMSTVHASIDLFKNNVDLIPGTKGFDVDLANKLTGLLTPYELRVEGKLQGYSIPVQPIIDQLRQQITAERTAAPAAATAVAPASAVAPPADAPQAGITSKAGSGTQGEDFSTLFGTIGLPNLQI